MTLLVVPMMGTEIDDAAAKAWKKGLCKSCHGVDGSGDTPVGRNLGAKDLRSEGAQSLTDQQIEAQVRDGKNEMPSYEGVFNAEEIKAVVRYVRLLAQAAKSEGEESEAKSEKRKK